MNLVRFLLVGAIITTLLGEFGHYPFGAASNSIQLTDVMVGLTGIFFIIWKIINHEKLKPIPLSFKIIVVFWGVGLVSLLLSLTFLPVAEVIKGSLYLVRFIGYSSLYLISGELSNGLWNKQLQWLIINCGVVMALIGFFQLILYGNFQPLTLYGFDPHLNRLAGTLLDPNFVGAYLTLSVSLLIYQITRKKDLVLWMQLIILIVAIIFTFSRSAYLMMTIFLIVLGILKYKKILLFLIPVMLVVMIVVPRVSERIIGGVNTDKSSSARLESWQNGLTLFQEHPVLGIGFNTLRSVQTRENLIKVYSVDGGHAGSGLDSSWLLVFVTTGVVGGLVFMSFWGTVLLGYMKRRNTLSLVMISLLLGFVIESQFINSLFYSSLMVLYFPLLGINHEK